ncbi:MAG: hypothetical protein FWG82_05370 [Oscillospiraceae bacterium]|nr:hypothetical protein [Oscillospiraceae bacterium]
MIDFFKSLDMEGIFNIIVNWYNENFTFETENTLFQKFVEYVKMLFFTQPEVLP